MQIVSVVLRSHSTDYLALAYKAQFHANSGHLHRAIDSALHSLAYNPQCILAWTVVGKVFCVLGDLAMAERCLLVALSCDPRSHCLNCGLDLQQKLTNFLFAPSYMAFIG